MTYLTSTKGKVKNKCVWKWKHCKRRTSCNIHSRDADQPCLRLQRWARPIPVLPVCFWSCRPTSIKLDRTDTWPLPNSTVSQEAKGWVEAESCTAALPAGKANPALRTSPAAQPRRAGCSARTHTATACSLQVLASSPASAFPNTELTAGGHHTLLVLLLTE